MLKHQLKNASQKQGMAPGSLMYMGESKLEPASLDITLYSAESIQESPVELSTIPETNQNVWLNIVGLHDIKTIEALGEKFSLHPLTLEDIVSAHQRPKVEFFDDYIYVVLKMLYVDNDKLHYEQLSLILGDSFVLSFQERLGDVFDPIRKRLQNPKSRLRNLNSDYLLYALIDVMVDAYFGVLEHYSEALEFIEEDIIDLNNKNTMMALRDLRHELLLLRKSVMPVRDLLSSFRRENPVLISDNVLLYLNDVQDHAIQVNDALESLRELNTSLHDFYLSQLSYRMNEVMKVLTIISTIFIPLSFLVGVYGMNFERMPELQWADGYYALWGVMITIVISMLIYFWRKRWFD